MVCVIELRQAQAPFSYQDYHNDNNIMLPTLAEFYDSNGRVEPTVLQRKQEESSGGVRDYHWPVRNTPCALRASALSPMGSSG